MEWEKVQPEDHSDELPNGQVQEVLNTKDVRAQRGVVSAVE
jgi:hypothetical protein